MEEDGEKEIDLLPLLLTKSHAGSITFTSLRRTVIVFFQDEHGEGIHSHEKRGIIVWTQSVDHRFTEGAVFLHGFT
jgi:hypothetical protein